MSAASLGCEKPFDGVKKMIQLLQRVFDSIRKRQQASPEFRDRLARSRRRRLFADPQTRPHTATIGASGSGKSLGTLPDLIEIVESGKAAMILMDSQGMLSKHLMLHLEKRGRLARVLYDQLGSYERLLAPRFLIPSHADNPLRRDAENHAGMLGFLDVLWTASGRDDKDWETMPMLSMYLELGLRLFIHQPTPLIPQLFPFVFRLNHPVFHYLLNNTFDEEAREEFADLWRIAKRGNDNLLEQRLGAARRLTRQVFSVPAFSSRMACALNVGKTLREKKIIMIDGADDGAVPAKAVTAIFRMWNYAAYIEQIRHYTLFCEPLPVVYVWEECADANIIARAEKSMLRGGRKVGASIRILTQDLAFLDPETRSVVLENTPCHEWYNPGDYELAMDAARDIAVAQLDLYRIHSQTHSEKVLHDGFEREERVGRTVHGITGEISQSFGEHLVPQYRKVVETQTRYSSPDDQIMEKARQLITMRPGWKMTRVRGKSVSTEPEYSPRLPEPYPHDRFPGLAEIKLLAAIERSQEAPEFITPEELDTSWAETTTQSPVHETNGHGNSSTFTPLPTNNSSQQGSTRRKKRRGKGSNGGRATK